NLLELEEESGEGGGQRAWIPNADISEGPEDLSVQVELPGVSLDELSLTVNGGNIIIRGTKNPPEIRGAVRRTHLGERAFGGFERVVSLTAPINTHKAVATLRDRLVKIPFPKGGNRRGGEVSIAVTGGCHPWARSVTGPKSRSAFRRPSPSCRCGTWWSTRSSFLRCPSRGNPRSGPWTRPSRRTGWSSSSPSATRKKTRW